MIPRRSFLRGSLLAGVTVLGVGGETAFRADGAVVGEGSSAGRDKFRLGMAGYTFHKFKLEPTLEMMRRVDVHYLCIKDFHLPLTSTEEEIATFHGKCREYGVTGYGVGPIYMSSEEEARRAFEYARRVGVRLVVGVPFKKVGEKRVASPELLRSIDRLVREFDIRYAIHNHGPDMPELFPNAESGMEIIRTMDSRVGLCFDIGHEFRDGKDPVVAMEKYADRIHDIHLKNVTSPDKKGRAAELPRGAMDLVGFVKVLRKVGYAGVLGLEYEKDMNDPLLGIAESVGYFRGLMDATR